MGPVSLYHFEWDRYHSTLFLVFFSGVRGGILDRGEDKKGRMRMKAKLTIRDIARLAGVSKSTVSRVLNQSEKVDPATRARVQQVMEEHGYVPSIAATGLAGGRNRLIGITLPSLAWPISLEVIRGIADVVEESPYEIILYGGSDKEKDPRQVLERVLATHLADGLLTLLHTQMPQKMFELYEQGFPVVLINTTAMRVNIPWVGIDNVAAARTATRHLLELGHRRIACVLGAMPFGCIEDRYNGYCQALAEVGLTPDPELVVSGAFNEAGGAECARKLFALKERPSAVFVNKDSMAYGFIEEALRLGWRVPDDIAVVGFDDVSPQNEAPVALTTINQPFARMGARGTELLLALIEEKYRALKQGGERGLPVQDITAWQVLLPTQLVVRESCGARRQS
ncbi:LacI family transcriptional regulator [Thermosporothrix hazakensis]|uniref:LacI family transcriptional regulator n=2 Tax=Thermosporothrix hazakensis TaxID=644383 RepID=A0A326UDJ5_THEHA|nr:LacI family transcriptional regulator [Thermosporothrix hazakensis]